MDSKELNEEYRRLQEETHKCIDSYGLNDPRTISASQELDKIVVEITKERIEENGRINKSV